MHVATDLTSSAPPDHPEAASRDLMNANRARAGTPWLIPPLIARELLVYSRQAWTYWLRLLSALGAVSVLALITASGEHRLKERDGLALFAGSTVILFFIASLNGLRSTSNCIASERVLRLMSPARTTMILVTVYCAIAGLIHWKLRRLVRCGDAVQRLWRRAQR